MQEHRKTNAHPRISQEIIGKSRNRRCQTKGQRRVVLYIQCICTSTTTTIQEGGWGSSRNDDTPNSRGIFTSTSDSERIRQSGMGGCINKNDAIHEMHSTRAATPYAFPQGCLDAATAARAAATRVRRSAVVRHVAGCRLATVVVRVTAAAVGAHAVSAGRVACRKTNMSSSFSPIE